jgi:hypothetical protein
MLFSTIVRWELFRLGLATLARAIVFDAEPTSSHRSRGEHFRNGLGTLLFVSSEVGLHRNLVASSWYAARDPARSDFRYGVSELRKAEPLASGRQFARRHPLALLVATSAGVGLGSQALGRAR